MDSPSGVDAMWEESSTLLWKETYSPGEGNQVSLEQFDQAP